MYDVINTLCLLVGLCILLLALDHLLWTMVYPSKYVIRFESADMHNRHRVYNARDGNTENDPPGILKRKHSFIHPRDHPLLIAKRSFGRIRDHPFGMAVA